MGGEHRTQRGEKSTFEQNGGKRTPNHVAKHRDGTVEKGRYGVHLGYTSRDEIRADEYHRE